MMHDEELKLRKTLLAVNEASVMLIADLFSLMDGNVKLDRDAVLERLDRWRVAHAKAMQGVTK